MKFSQAHYETKHRYQTKREEEKKAKREQLTIKWTSLHQGNIKFSDCRKFQIAVKPYPVRPGNYYELSQTDTGQKLATCSNYLNIRYQAELFKANPNKRTDRGTRRQKPERN